MLRNLNDFLLNFRVKRKRQKVLREIELVGTWSDLLRKLIFASNDWTRDQKKKSKSWWALTTLVIIPLFTTLFYCIAVGTIIAITSKMSCWTYCDHDDMDYQKHYSKSSNILAFPNSGTTRVHTCVTKPIYMYVINYFFFIYIYHFEKMIIIKL